MRKPKLPNGRSELLALARDFRSVADDPRCGLGAMVRGALRVMEESALEPDEVLDLVPVKPLAELEPVISEGFRGRLTAIMEKIRPPAPAQRMGA